MAIVLCFIILCWLSIISFLGKFGVVQKAKRGTFIAFKDNPNYKKIIKKDSFVRKLEKITIVCKGLLFVILWNDYPCYYSMDEKR